MSAERPAHAGVRVRRVPSRRYLPLAALLAAALAQAVPEPRAAAAAPEPADSTQAVSRAPADSSSADSTTAAGGVPQRDVFDVVARILGKPPVESEITITRRRGLSITLLPALGYNPSYGGYLGLSASMGGWIGPPETTTLSAGSASITYSTTKQLSVQFKSDFYTADNKFALKGDWRYLDTSQPTYGLGPATVANSESPMSFVLYRFYQTVYWHVPRSKVYVGLGLHFNRWDEIEETDAAPGEETDYRIYSGGAVSRATTSGLSVNALMDTRDNPINAQAGAYWNLSYRSYTTALGGDDEWQGISSDFRIYPRVGKKGRHTLAIWNYTWLTFGQAPYLDLPASGWDTYGRGARGYLQGRLRGRNQIYTEAEYRFDLRKDGLLGGVVFTNFMATTLPLAMNFGQVDPGIGAGLRLKFNKRTSTNLTIDAAWDRFGVGHMFLAMQEAF
ncbi:MAG TPA: hypothetical protein VFS09_11995 [Candidatus Eisenbacteria bacterium]|nr:hypothetical protein [Candidatus Eisenbacteria bacterium]